MNPTHAGHVPQPAPMKPPGRRMVAPTSSNATHHGGRS
jgi:hypothetical protein